MAEYIERTEELMLAMNAGARAIENTKRYHGAVYAKDLFSDNSQGIPYLLAAKVLREVSDAPAADVAPVVHARWIPSESDFDDDDILFDGEECCDWQCSACREDICYEDPMPMKLLPNYCPNCGAKMDVADGGADHDA